MPSVSTRLLLLLVVALTLAPTHSQAQEPKPPLSPSVARFVLPSSGLEWRAPVHPLKFFDATGRRAGVFGKQTGQYEAWIYPIKVLHGFRLEFRQEGMAEPVRGEAYLEEIVARPESTMLVYVHPLFTVRQIIWTPRDEPAVVNFFDVDSDKPLAITAKFVPDFKPMWPASLGGQYSYWLADEKAFGLTDATSKPTAIIGSPATGAFTEHMDHALVGGEMLLQLRVTPEDARKTLPSIVMALDMESSAKARAVYRNVLGRLRELYEARVAYHKDFLARTLQIETPDLELNRAFEWAKVSIDAGWVCTPTKFSEGCGLVAGYGPSGDSERPGFAWWFGGDALMASWAMLDYGDHEGALQVLRFLRARQRADGKMMHEMTQSVDLVDWFGKYGFAYYHADTTPMYIYSVAEYWRRTGDRKMLEEFWPSVQKAYEWCLTTVDPADGLMDNTKAGLAAVEVGPLRSKVTKDIYLQGFWLAALDAVAEFAKSFKETEFADRAIALGELAEKSIREQWWMPERKSFAFGLMADRRRADLLGNWPAVLHALNYFVDRPHLNRGINALRDPEILTDWGTRWLSNKERHYDPISYNNGSVWPFMSGFAAWAMYERFQSLGGFVTWSSSARLTGLMLPGGMPELVNGDRLKPGERAVPHQLFSSVGVVRPAVLGISRMYMAETTAPAARSFFFSPAPPAHWPFLRFAGFSADAGHVRGEIRQQRGRKTIVIEHDGNRPLDAWISCPLPFGARIKQLLANGRPRKTEPSNFHVQEAVARRLEVVVEFEGGVEIVPPEPKPEIGARSSALKLIETTDELNSPAAPILALTLGGLGARIYSLDLITTEPKLTAEGATVHKTEQGYRLEIAFEGPEGEYVTKQIKVKW